MSTSHDVFIAAVPAYQQLRNAYIDLQGLDVTHRVNQLGVNRQDEFGDIVNTSTFVDVAAKIVPDLSAYYKAIASYESNSATNEVPLIPLTAVCKLSMAINIGDRIKFGNDIAVLEYKQFQVADVETQIHVKPISKKITLVPVRD